MLQLLAEVAFHEYVFGCTCLVGKVRAVFHLLEMVDRGRECPQRLVEQDLGRGNDEARLRNAHGIRSRHLRHPVEGSTLQRLRDTSLEDFKH